MDLRDSLRAAFGVERLAIWGVAALAVGAVLVVASAGGVGLVGPPTASFDVTYDGDASAVTVSHAGGDALDVSRVTVAITDQSGHSANVSWPTDDRPQIGQGASVVIDDATVDSDGDGNVFDRDATVGFALAPGTTVEVLWTGRPIGAADTTTVTLDSTEIEGQT